MSQVQSSSPAVAPPDRSAAIDRVSRILEAGAAASGGWGYYPGKASRVEPTCWSLLALAATTALPRAAWLAAIDPHLQFLARSQRADGLLHDLPSPLPNLTSNGLAALACLQIGGGTAEAILTRLVPALLRIKGVSVENKARASDALQGWPWIEGTFSWVEPTSFCLLALKRERRRGPSAAGDARIREAEQVLLTRSCAAGGWNYGNASALDQDLRPYVPTTALSLLALQDRPADPAVVRGLAFLQRSQTKEASGMALALTALCFRVHGLPCAQVELALINDIARVNRLSNLNVIAMVLYVLSGDEHGAAAFTV